MWRRPWHWSAKVGTSSMRRQCQLLAVRPDVQIGMLRGNVPTRIKKLDDGGYDAIILASAGLNRLALGARITQPEYPSSARREGVEGTVVVAIFVKEDGRPGEVKVAKSSGSQALDDAAVKEVQRNWKLVPGKEDGKPVAMWYNFAITFKLTN